MLDIAYDTCDKCGKKKTKVVDYSGTPIVFNDCDDLCVMNGIEIIRKK